MVIAALLDRNKAAGRVRPDITVSDVYLMVGGLSATIRTESRGGRRYVELVLEGHDPRLPMALAS